MDDRRTTHEGKMFKMGRHSSSSAKIAPHRVEIKLRDLNQLFNTMDPSPFLEKDLDDDAEEFIVNWVREFPLQDPVVLTVHVSQSDPVRMPDAPHRKSHPELFPVSRETQLHGTSPASASRSNQSLHRIGVSDLLPFSRGIAQRNRGTNFPGGGPGRAHHRGMGRDVAAAGNLSVRLVARAPAIEGFRETRRNESRDTL